LRDHARLLYKAADVIGGMPADNIGGFLQDQRLIAQGHLEKLVLRSHWGGAQDIDVFDFTLPHEATNHVISVRFDDNGAVKYISKES